MHLRVTQKIIGILLMVFSLAMLPPLLVSLLYSDGAHMAFIEAFAITLGAGLIIWLPVARYQKVLRTRDGFVIVVMFWTILGIFG
ncbi:MAG: potassium transporter, partial [Pseudomonadales bacterium]